MAEADKVRRPRMRSWEADEDIAALLELAQKTTGASLKDIVNAAVRIHAPLIIRRLLEERMQAETELISLLDRQFAAGPKPSTATVSATAPGVAGAHQEDARTDGEARRSTDRQEGCGRCDAVPSAAAIDFRIPLTQRNHRIPANSWSSRQFWSRSSRVASIVGLGVPSSSKCLAKRPSLRAKLTKS